jgi:hypothetical protein
MKLLTTLTLTLAVTSNVRAVTFKCLGADYNRVDTTKKYLSSGDSNGSFNFELNKVENPNNPDQSIYQESASYRFVASQGGDDTLSLYGVKVTAKFEEANGYTALFVVNKYKTTKEDSKSSPISHFVLSSDEPKRWDSIGVLGPKFFDLVKDDPFSEFDLPKAVKDKKLLHDDLLAVNLKWCAFTE